MAARHSASVPLLGGDALLERAVTYSLGQLNGVDPAGLDRPTPCARWDLGDLLGHLYDSVLVLAEAGRCGRVDAEPAGPPAPTDLVAAVRDAARRLLGTWATGRVTDADVDLTAPGEPSSAGATGQGPFGPAISLPTGIVAGAGALEIAVHSWDVGVASGRRRPIPAALAGELYDLARLLVSDADRPVRFAARIPQPAAAGPADRLLGFLGREP